MNVKFLNPFLEAAIEVLKAEVGIDVNRGSLDLQKTALTTDDVTVVIHLVGNVYGVVLIGLSVPTSLKIVSNILGQEFSEFSELAQSGIAELGNVITGQATVKLSQAGYSSDISPPAMVIGKGVQISTLDFSRVIVPIKTELGDLVVHLALREAQPGKTNHPDEFVPLNLKI